jgi:hypothetical protein
MLPNTATLYDSEYYLVKGESADDEGYTKFILSPGTYYIYDLTGTSTLTEVEINSLETDQSMNGELTSENDFNMYSYIPVTDAVYNFSGSGECQITATIYDSVGTVIGSSDNSENLNYSIQLEASKTYYVKIASKSGSGGVYALTVSEQTYEDNVTIAKNQIQVCIPYGRDATIYLYNASNSLINTRKVESSDNIISDRFDLSNMQSKYKLQVKDQNKTVAVFNISIITSTQQFAITPKSYLTVPVFAANVADLSDIYFSLNFDSSKISLYDPCEETYTVVETTPQFVSSANIDILDIKDNMVVFKSSKTTDDIVNTVKLKSETSGIAEVTVYAYKVQ